MADLDGKVAVVTGGAKGIGLGCAECLSAAGASVVIADINVDEGRQSAEKLPGPAVAIEHDVRSPESAKALDEATQEKFGRLDIILNNAGVAGRAIPLAEMPVEEWDRVVGVNARGTFLTTRALVPRLIAQKSGRIINIASVMGRTGFGLINQYNASKFAVIGMTQSFASELAAHNITSNAICPGVVKTDLHTGVVSDLSGIQGTTMDEGWEQMLDMIPLKRLQTATDIGEMAAFLASDRAQNITGASMVIDGGFEVAA